MGGSIVALVSLLEDVGGSECKSGVLLVEVIGTGIALGGWVRP